MTDESRDKVKKQLLDILTRNFTISSACRAVGIDRKTFYRWCEEDTGFSKQAQENIQESRKDITDLAHIQLVNHIKNGDLKAAIYWLNHKDPELLEKVIAMTDEEIKELSTLLYNPDTFQQGQELLTSYVLKQKVPEGHAQFILRMFTAQMKAEDIIVRKTEANVMSEVLLRKEMNKSRKR